MENGWHLCFIIMKKYLANSTLKSNRQICILIWTFETITKSNVKLFSYLKILDGIEILFGAHVLHFVLVYFGSDYSELLLLIFKLCNFRCKRWLGNHSNWWSYSLGYRGTQFLMLKFSRQLMNFSISNIFFFSSENFTVRNGILIFFSYENVPSGNT